MACLENQTSNQNPKQKRKEDATRRRFLQACKCWRNLSYPSVLLPETATGLICSVFLYRCSHSFMVIADGKNKTLKTDEHIRIEA